jgi:hypothetical protein
MEEILQEIKLIKSRLDKIENRLFNPPSIYCPVVRKPKIEPFKPQWSKEDEYNLMELFHEQQKN